MKFDYYAPSSLQEAFALLAREGGEAKVLAGGTDLLLQMRRRVRSYRAVVNIKSIPDLVGISSDAGGDLSIGAAATFRALETGA
ncbi:MAG: FAD binding domain-containing protein, partial [Chloroflexi bacterium]|nr:FAD binding domain-containing protein [Chloroflexota bacterium]